MIKSIGIFTAFVVALFICKATGTPVFGHVPTWFVVFLPWLLQGVYAIGEAYAISKQWDIKLKAILWRAALKIRVYFIRKKARKDFRNDVAKRSNPGQFIDPQNRGK